MKQVSNEIKEKGREIIQSLNKFSSKIEGQELSIDSFSYRFENISNNVCKHFTKENQKELLQYILDNDSKSFSTVCVFLKNNKLKHDKKNNNNLKTRANHIEQHHDTYVMKLGKLNNFNTQEERDRLLLEYKNKLKNIIKDVSYEDILLYLKKNKLPIFHSVKHTLRNE